ncbi:DUF1768-domain-containing protein [Mycena rosella]|uniref:DUF1768-domain-containing protein n=1 Tax=Mycena rosella TaxID=1033263 RepID=A0AAD7GNS2_MYCRO|nr:DUF1768-domain-containing protein [Mycena rosella]
MVAPRQRIFIHPQDNQYQGFTNRAPYTVKYNGKEYPSSQHLYQAFKYMDNRPDIAEKIRTISKSSIKAFKYSMKNIAHQHPDWDRMRIAKMEITLYHKFAQHEQLKQALLRTGDAELIRHTEDDFWGIGKDQKGRNEQGKALERVRSSLQEACPPPK